MEEYVSHWSERLECHVCGTTFRSAITEARHRHNFPTFCKRNKRFKAFMEENHGPKSPEGR